MFKFRYVIHSGKARLAFYGNEGDGANAGANTGDANTNGQQGGQANTGAGEAKAFTQEDINKIVKKEKESWKKSQEKQLDELKQLRESLTLNEQQKADMDTRIKELENQVLSKEELAAREKKRLEESSKKEVDRLTGEANHWKDLYTRKTIEDSIKEEAMKQKAFSPQQIFMMLHAQTRLVPVVAEDGKPTGKYKSEINWTEVKDGVTVEVSLPVAEVIKRMKEAPEQFGNLFETDARGGVGGNNNTSVSRAGITPSTLKDPEFYRKNRESVIKQSTK